jgi:hypothetical protein
LVVALAACGPSNAGGSSQGRSAPGWKAPYVEAVKRIWDAENRMNTTNDAGLLDLLETGNALQGDRAVFSGVQAQGLGPLLKAPLPAKGITVWVPSQSGYPAHFLALVDTVQTDAGQPTARPSAFLFDLVRSSSQDGWKIGDWAVLADPAAKPPLALNGSGQASVLSRSQSTGRLLVEPDQLSQTYADAIVHVASGHTDGDSVGADGWTTGLLRQRGASDQSIIATGATVDDTVTQAGGSGAWVASGGGALVFFHVAMTQTVAATPGKLPCVVQQGGGKGAMEYVLPPGRYSQVTVDSLYTVVAVDPPKGSHSKVQVVGGYGLAVNATGNPSSCG